MFSKKFIISFIALSLMLGFLLSFMKINYVFDKIQNTHITNLNKKRYSSANYEATYKASSDKFLILNGNNEADIEIYANFKQVISDMDKDLISMPLNNFKGDTTGYRGIILNTENFTNFIYLPKLIEYAKKGGNLIFPQRPLVSSSLKEVSKDIGIEKFNYDDTFDSESMYVKTNIMIQGYGLKRTEETINSSINIENTKDCIIHIVDNKDVPILWEKNLEKGKVFVVNGQFLTEKSNRGILTGILYRTGHEFIYPIINSKVFFIDDFPAPIPKGTSPSVYNNYHMNDQRFFTDVWWPDIVEICSKYNMKPTGYLIYNYQDVTDDIADFKGDYYYESLMTQGRDLFKVGGEMGVHGFNHQPLRMKSYPNDSLGYKPWKNYNDMVNAQIALDKFFHNVYPNYDLKGYVPPSNIISEKGIQALKEGIPNINVISALYIVNKDDIYYGQEFSKGKYGIYNFPRYSSGYYHDEFQKWVMYNGITINGVFAHFNHPDDILDPERSNGFTWEELKKQFAELMEEIYQKFKWLKSNTISQGVGALDEYLTTKSAFEYEGNIVKGSLKTSGKDDYFVLRTDKPIKNSKGCTYEKIDNEIYLIHSNETDFEIILGGN